MKFDYLTFVVCDNERDLAVMQIRSLLEYSSKDNFNIRMNIRKGDTETIDYIKKTLGNKVDEIVETETFVQKIGPRNTSLNQAGYDLCNRMDVMMAGCTTNWVIATHADIVFHSSLTNAIGPMIADEKGMIGIWPHGLTVLNRAAFNASHFKFWPFPHIFLQNDRNNLRIRGVFDDKKEKIIDSLDVSVTLTVELQGLGYLYDEASSLGGHVYYHLGGQSYHGVKAVLGKEKELHFNHVQRTKQRAIESYGRFIGADTIKVDTEQFRQKEEYDKMTPEEKKIETEKMMEAHKALFFCPQT